MKFSAWLFCCALAVVLCAGLSGCMPPGQGQLDDEKEPHFIEGKRALNGMDYSGAIDEFEKAVEANPRNASAHFELGWLYEEKEPDPAAAIYHYQQFLKLRPTADTAEAVKQRIMNCKQDLAKAVLPLPSSPGVQHDLEQLIQENKQLRAELDQWRAYYRAQTNRQAEAAAPPPRPAQVSAVQTQAAPVVQAQQPVSSNPPPNLGNAAHVSPRSNGGRTYVVQRGDTMAAISRKFNVKLESLGAVNPGLNAKKLRVGQTVNIP
ncbi:MAG TPA: LysM peptidoglycan-binding domain-containing protein [Verrucomicrobiae bacterium]|jgi:tetratricopeptide (TPR) repeat protein|nr:LysM peptidoglycan-binding domain-containing protein [Verrucomicrobiae bacterium]